MLSFCPPKFGNQCLLLVCFYILYHHFFLNKSPFSPDRHFAFHGLWICGVQEARGCPESPAPAPGEPEPASLEFCPETCRNLALPNGAEHLSAVACTGQVEKPLNWARFLREEGLLKDRMVERLVS